MPFGQLNFDNYQTSLLKFNSTVAFWTQGALELLPPPHHTEPYPLPILSSHSPPPTLTLPSRSPPRSAALTAAHLVAALSSARLSTSLHRRPHCNHHGAQWFGGDSFVNLLPHPIVSGRSKGVELFHGAARRQLRRVPRRAFVCCTVPFRLDRGRGST